MLAQLVLLQIEPKRDSSMGLSPKGPILYCVVVAMKRQYSIILTAINWICWNGYTLYPGRTVQQPTHLVYRLKVACIIDYN